MPLVADWATTAALLGVLLAEGIRRLPAGAIVLRRTLRGNWRIVHGPTVRPEWRLVSIWAPFLEHLVIQAGMPADLFPTDDGGRQGDHRRRLPSRLTIATFRIAGGALLLVVALGVPAATATFGITGLARSVVLAFLCSTVVALSAAMHLERIVGGWRAALTSAAPLLSPFAAPRVAEMLLQTTVNGLAASAALEVLVRPDDFQRWARVHAYDTLEARSSALGCAPGGRLEAIIAAIPESCGHGDRFCPRCGAVFLAHVEECSDCVSVVLRGDGVAGGSSEGGANPRRTALPTVSPASARMARYVN